MQRKWEAMYYLQKILGFPVVALCLAVPSLASADTIVTTQSYVTDYAVKRHNWASADRDKALFVKADGSDVEARAITGLPSGTSAQILQHNGTSWTATGLGTTADSTAEGYDANKLVAAGTIVAELNKKVNTAQGAANVGKTMIVNTSGNLEASYVQVPNFDPEGQLPQNPTFSYFWLQ